METTMTDKTTAEERLAVIRDAFLEGRDLDAVQQILEVVNAGNAKLFAWSQPDVPAQSSVTLYARPQRPMDLKQIVVADRCADFFEVVQMTIGVNIQMLVTSGPLHTGFLAQGNARPLSVTFDPVMPGMDVMITVRNRDQVYARDFDAFAWGFVRSSP
jgi:hypothetical protein